MTSLPSRLRAPIVATLCLLIACKGDKGTDTGDDDTAGGDTSSSDTGTVDTGTITTGDVRVDGGEALTTDPVSTGVQLCTSGDQIYIAWTDDRSGTANVWVNASSDAGTTWLTTPVNASQSAGEAGNPSLACDGSTAWLAWEDSRDSQFGNEAVWTSRTTDGGTSWLAAADIGLQTDVEHDANAPFIAGSGANVVVAWTANPGGGFDVHTAASHDGGATFGTPVAVESDSPGASYSARPQVAFMASGDVRVVWEDRRTGVMTIRGVRSGNAGDSYGTDRAISDGVEDAFNVRLATASNQTYATWHQGTAGARLDVYAAWAETSSSAFATSLRVSSDDAGARDDVRPRLAMDSGYGHIAWYTETLGGYHVTHTALQDGVVTQAPTRVDRAADAARADRPSIIQAGGVIAVGWEDDRDASVDGNHDLYIATTTDQGATWDGDYRVSTISPGASAQTELQLGSNSELIFAAWSDARQGNFNVYFTTFDVPGGAR